MTEDFTPEIPYSDLHIAAVMGHYEEAKKILDTEPDPEARRTLLAVRDKFNNPPLVYAINSPYHRLNLPLIRLFVENGAEVHCIVGNEGRTPLMVAEMMSAVPESEVVTYLKQTGADTDAMDNSGMNAQQLGDRTREAIARIGTGGGLPSSLEEKRSRRSVGRGGVDTAGVMMEQRVNRGHPGLIL